MEVRPGVYRHYKGKSYYVVGPALHANSKELVVVYVALYENENGPHMFVRGAAEFYGDVRLKDGRVVKRFSFVSLGP